MEAASGGGNSHSLKRGASQIQFEYTKKFCGKSPPYSTRAVHHSQDHRTHTHSQSGMPHSQIPLQNQYDLLGAYNDQDMQDDTNTASVTNTPKIPKTAPVVVVGSNATDLQNLLNESIASKKFEIKMMKVGIRVNIPEATEHKLALENLKSKGFQYYTYHTAATRPVKVVLYGLHDMKCEDLQKVLKELSIEPAEIKKLNLRKPNYDKQAVYLLYFKPGTTTMAKLREIKSINHIIVRWEKYHPRSYDNIAQCRNCQRLGHSSVNCNLAARCLVCAGDHKTEECVKRIPRVELKKKTDPDRSFIKCINCGGQHTANYQGCSSRKEFIQTQQRLNERNGRRRHNTAPNFNYEHDFPTLSQQQRAVPRQPYFNQPWAEIVQSQRVNSTNDDLVHTLQVLVENMQSMMQQMMQMMSIFIKQAAATR